MLKNELYVRKHYKSLQGDVIKRIIRSYYSIIKVYRETLSNELYIRKHYKSFSGRRYQTIFMINLHKIELHMTDLFAILHHPLYQSSCIGAY